MRSAALISQPAMRRRTALLAGCVAALLSAVPAIAGAASVSVDFSPDPTEEIPVTVTVSGTADVATRLFAYVVPGSGSCPATAGGVSPIYEISGTGPFSGGESLPSGTYARPYTYTPADASPYRVCAYLAATASSAPQATGAALLTPRRPTATVTTGESADPTEEKPITYTVSGTTEVDRRLYVFAVPGAGSCPATASGVSPLYEISGSGPFSGGETVPAGAFDRTFTYTPADSGTTHVCSYVSETAAALPNASDTWVTSVREPTADVAIGESADPTEEKPITYTVSGTTEVDRRLYVFAVPGAGSCPATASGVSSIYEIAGSGPFSAGETVAAGAFSRALAYTPADSGTTHVCAYVSETSADVPNAVASHVTVAREPTAAVTVGIAAGPTIAQPVTVDVAGTTELDRRLYVFAVPGAGSCPATASGVSSIYEIAGSGPFSAGETVAAGAFSRALRFTPGQGGPHHVCAYVAESEADAPNATADVLVNVYDPTPTRNELHVGVPGTVPHGQPVPIGVTGAAADAGYLFTYVQTGTGACKETAREQSRAALRTITSAQRLSVGPVTSAGSFGPAASGRYRVCSYAAPSSADEPYATATATFTILPDPALIPVPVTADGDERRDRIVLVWKRGPDDDQDEIAVSLSDPAQGARPTWRYDVADSDELHLHRGSDRYRAVLPHLGYGRFWWTITRTGADGSEAQTAARMMRVVPRPLDRRSARIKVHVKLGTTSRHPGTASLLVASSPRATVRIVVRTSGRVAKRLGYRERYPGRRTLTFGLSCEHTGRTTVDVDMRDPYGTHLVRHGSWVTSATRCAQLRAAEQRAAEQRRAAERERQRQQSGGGGGGGSDYAGMTCSEIGHSFYVTPGSDPEHDADNDGIACESYG